MQSKLVIFYICTLIYDIGRAILWLCLDKPETFVWRFFLSFKKISSLAKSVSLKFETDIVVDLFIAKESEVEV
jgi:hypothetical protein